MKRKILNYTIRIISRIFTILYKVYGKIFISLYKSRMRFCGTSVILSIKNSTFAGLENFSIGNNTYIPQGATFYSTEANLVIGDNVMFGPNPTIITGDHRMDVVGTPMNKVHDKLPENDKDVIIEDEVWCGANVTILKGVTIGRGSIVAACALVNKSFPPYSIVAGIPARFVKFRFTVDEILRHEEKIYTEGKRLSREYLNAVSQQYTSKTGGGKNN